MNSKTPGVLPNPREPIMFGMSDATADEVSTGAVARHADARRVAAVLRGVLHDVRDAAEDVLDQVRHRVARRVAVGLAGPAIVHAGHHELAALVSSRARPRMTSSSLAVQPPPWMMTMIGRLRAPLGAVDVVLQRLHARLGEDDVVRDGEVP